MHLKDSVSTRDIIASSEPGKTVLCTRFREETGISISRYISEAKNREAESLLKYTDITLGEISSYLGFSSQSCFQNVFRKINGISPGKYRRKTEVRRDEA